MVNKLCIDKFAEFEEAIPEKNSFFSVEEKAWHSLGTTKEDYPTSSEAIRHAGLDYTFEKRPLYTVDNGQPHAYEPDLLLHSEIEVPDYFATIRTDTEQVLDVVDKDYEAVKNVEAFSFFDSIVDGGDGILYETVGALGNGERIFITANPFRV